MSKAKEKNIGFKNTPAKVREIVFALRDGLQNTINDKLIGLYLYGSLAYDCFNPEISDIDFVVVLSELLTLEEEQRISQLHKHLGCEPKYGKRLEGTYITEEQVKSDNYPPNFLYYVEGHEFVKAKNGQKEQDFPMHRQHLHESGVRIIGYDTQKLFKPVPWEVLKHSLKQEMPFIKEQFEKRPIYAVLNLCRVVRAYETRRLSSKKQGGEWGLQFLPVKFYELIKIGLNGYTNRITDGQKEFLIENLPLFYEYCFERTANS
ncbi:aminoglycoside adenylyltransferase domain-containing protein [Winogradskyella sp.]|uniref:aminoglycoside adenylyltransferase domain-containing protein n=1 Tax=Winogradskyella sp. TaxID=1883156 RepID=UPI00262D9BF5|nr:aminoglycoside adenylyltransferase domain-containing protein [Winogradskyella sp.]